MKKPMLLLFLIACLTACEFIDDHLGGHDIISVPPASVLEPEKQYELTFEVLSSVGEVEVRNGGFGSGSVAHPQNEGEFYAITDRGPNTNYLDGKKFPVANYTPRIGHFAVTKTGKIIKLKEILLKSPSGELISGLPNPEGKGATGEIPYDETGNLLPFDDFGLDSEGIVAMKDGSFWVCDEYGPHIVHYSADGLQMERISPMGVNDDMGDRQLPAVFAKRRANRGMEGLTITPDEKVLVGIMQSTMHNPESIRSNVTRIVTFDLESGASKQFLYFQENANLSNSEITAISNTEFLVVERDGKFSGEGDAQKHIYKINLEGATDVSSENSNDEFGLLVNGKTIEQNSADELIAAGINPVKKELVADLVEAFGYPHDKLEGIWLIDQHTIGCINDDDFAVIDTDGDGIIEQKALPGIESIDASSLYLLKVNF